MKTVGYATQSATEPLAQISLERRDLLDTDVAIDILYCGVCHSDIHTARNEWKGSTYPVLPGHEIVGKVVKIGKAVRAFHEGQFVAVGCMVDSCRSCPSCKDGLEQFCSKGPVFTYNSPDPHMPGKMTYGGYSRHIIVDEKFVLSIPEKFQEYQLPGIAPLLCAGITTYSPLKHWNVGPHSTVAVVGVGGLGHMAIKIAHALGAKVVVYTSSEKKRADAIKFGASEVIVSKNPEQMKKHLGAFDFILNSVAAPHNLDEYLELLKHDGVMCMIGLPEKAHPSPGMQHLIMKRRSLAGSLIGGIKETQEMLNFCADHGLLAEIEMIPIQKINEAYERMIKSDVRYRFVIDMSSLKE